MRPDEYIKDRSLVFILHIFCMSVLCGFLYVTRYPPDFCALIGGCWFLAAAVIFGIDYWQRRNYFQELSRILEKIDERYLLGELMPDSTRLEDRIYRDMIRLSNKSVIERVRAAEKEKKEYREFIESWVHEIKAPITGIALICENHKDEQTRRIREQNRRIENYVEMALYYARAGEVYKDYKIQKTDLEELVSAVLSRNKYDMIQNGVRAEVHCGHSVYTDEKWIFFILNQLILNSVKYKKGERELLSVYTKQQERSVELFVEDDGAGIKKEDIPRVFEKGFTGSNGRKNARATGMGLYLCKNLCEKLGIGIRISSREGEGTRVCLEFPMGTYYAREKERKKFED